MKVAFFLHSFPVVSEVFLVTSALALRDSGHKVTFFVLLFPSKEQRAAGRAFEAETGIRIVYPEHDELGWGDIISRWRLVRLLVRRHGLRKLPWLHPFVFRKTLLRSNHLRHAAMFQANARFDILHCQFGSLAREVSQYRKIGLISGKLVINFRGADISTHVAQFGQHVYDRVWPVADHIITVCEHFRDLVLEFGADPARVTVIGTGIDLSRFSYRAPTPYSSPVSLLFVGRLVDRKGAQLAVRALGNLKANGVAATLDIVGHGEMRDDLERAVAQLGLGDHVTFHGALPHDRVKEMMQSSQIFLAPSMVAADGGKEGVLNTAKEAMAVGLPVVASRHSGIVELVEDGKTGILCDEGSSEALTQAILRMIKAAPHWDEMCQNARARVTELYEIGDVTARQIALYERLLRAP